MALWIGVANGGSQIEIRVEGRLTQEAVAELDRVVGVGSPSDRIDLSQLLFADEAGLAALRRLQAAGVELVGVRPTIAYRLLEAGPNEHGAH